MTKTEALRRSRAQRDRHLTVKQAKFVKAYARLGNGTKAAKVAGYSASSNDVLKTMASENLRKPYLKAAAEAEIARIVEDVDYSAGRVRRRLDALSHGAERVEQYGVAVRAEELIGRAAGMFIDQSIQLKGTLGADHLDALIQVARSRQAQPIDLAAPAARKRLLDE